MNNLNNINIIILGALGSPVSKELDTVLRLGYLSFLLIVLIFVVSVLLKVIGGAK